MYDAIVVGARCAGAPTAMLLARRGYRVLMVDRASFPSDTLSTHFIQLPGMARLKRWGLLDRVLATNCPVITTAVVDVGPVQFEGGIPDGTGLGNVAPRRIVLDKLLIDEAVAAGAEFREGFFVDELTTKDGRVTGVVGHTNETKAIAENARIVIGADGRHSKIAELVQTPTSHDVAPLIAGYYSYWSGFAEERTHVHINDRHDVVTFPTNDGLTCIVGATRAEEFGEFKTDVEGRFLKALADFPSVADLAAAGNREERFTGTADVPNFFRRPWGPGWALVGDASYHKDPTPADGISDAFRSVDYIAEAIDQWLSGEAPEDQAMSGYQARRDEAAMPMYDLCLKMSSFDQPLAERGQAFFMLSELRRAEAEALVAEPSAASV